MLEVTGWALLTWIKLTLVLAFTVAIAWLTLGHLSGWFWVITATAAVGELYLVRQLAREWGHEARYRWWWAR